MLSTKVEPFVYVVISSVYMYWNYPNYQGSFPLSDPQLGLSQISGSVEDGVYTCTFYRDPITNITPPSLNTNMIFDLDNSTYYLLMAKGPVKGGNKNKTIFQTMPIDFSLKRINSD